MFFLVLGFKLGLHISFLSYYILTINLDIISNSFLISDCFGRRLGPTFLGRADDSGVNNLVCSYYDIFT